MIEVGRQVVASALLAALDENHAARVRPAFVLQRLQRGERAEHRVAVVGAAAPVELAVDHARLPRPVALVPADHLRLLVEVAVDQNGFRLLSCDFHEQHRRAALEAYDFELHALERVRLAPLHCELQRRVDVAVLLPVAVEVRRLRRDADVFGDRRDDRVVPELSDGFQDARCAARARAASPKA